MTQTDMYSINHVAAKLGLSVHQLRRWELMFGLEIKRGRGQQRQYKNEDLTVLERIKELVEQGWPTSQIRPQLEAEGMLTPKLIGLPQNNPVGDDVLMEFLIGFRNFNERRFIDLSKQIDELRQLIISITAKQELKGEDFLSGSFMDAIPKDLLTPAQPEVNTSLDYSQTVEISLGPVVNLTDVVKEPKPSDDDTEVTARKITFGEITDQNYLTVLGRALDTIGWSDEEADEYSLKNFKTTHWDELGRSFAQEFINHIINLLSQTEQAVESQTEI